MNETKTPDISRAEIEKLRKLFGEFYDEDSRAKTIYKKPDIEYPTVQKYVDHLYELGIPRGTSVKKMGIILESWYENISKAPEYAENTMTGAPEYAVKSNTLTPDQLKQFQEEAEARRAKGEAAAETAKTNVAAGIKRQQEIYAEQIRKIEAKKKEFEEQTRYAKVQETKLAEDQQKEFNALQKAAKANPKETVQVVSKEIKDRLGDSVPQEAADAAAVIVVANLNLSNTPVIQTAVTASLSNEVAIKAEKEVAELLTSLSDKTTAQIDLAKGITTQAFGQDFQKAIFPNIQVSDAPQSGFVPVSLSFVPTETTKAIENRLTVLQNPFLEEKDYTDRWLGSSLNELEGDGSLVQGTITFASFRQGGGQALPQAEIQNKLNTISGASTLKNISGLAGGMAKQAAAKGITKAITGLISKAAAPETAGLSLVVGQVVNWLADHINPQTLKKWALVAATVSATAVGIVFGIPILTTGGLIMTGFAVAGAFNLTAAGIGSGIVGVLGAIGAATLGAIGGPILAILLGFPIVVALILFIINSGAYVVPPSPIGSAMIHIPPGGNLTKCDPAKTGKEITQELAISMNSGSVLFLPDSAPSRKEGLCMTPTMIILHTSSGYDNDDGNIRTYETLVQRRVSCQMASDTNDTILMLSFFEKQVENAWCADNLNAGGVSIEMAGEPDAGFGPFSKCAPTGSQIFTPNGPHPCPKEEDLSFDAVCKVMQKYKIPWTQVFQHEASNGTHTDPVGDAWVDKFILRLKNNCRI